MISNMPSPDTFNAKWIPPENVAETFVPIPQFRQLAHNSHTLLLGPRGCGKTTLLKMLTRIAQQKWRTSGRGEKFKIKINRPTFEAVYIPSDVRWSFEINAIGASIRSSKQLVLRAQRVMVGLNGIFHLLGTVKELLSDDRNLERQICEQLIRRLRLNNTLPTITDVRCSLEGVTADLRGDVSSNDAKNLKKSLRRVPPFIYGHALDAVTSVIRFVSEQLPLQNKPSQWALCYDELEIAPEWLRQELVGGLRSGPQDVLLKLTWHPVLPTGIPTSPSVSDDFRSIRLWHSHVEDPRQFCEDLTQEFLRREFGDDSPTPTQFFSRSILASEEADDSPKAYERGSTEYEAFCQLAKWDKPFVRKLIEHGIDPNDPVPRNQVEKDQFFRKVKPIVLLRNEFLSKQHRRSRKSPALYVGREAIYAISEGNPRWLLSLLTDLVDLGEPSRAARSPLNVSYPSQARILTNTSIRFRSLIKSSPFRPPDNVISTGDHTLLDFVTLLGTQFQASIHNKREFREDPIGSFTFTKDTSAIYSAMVTQLLEMGALVFVGSSKQDVPTSIVGSRFRLSFMLAPIFRLAFRNFKPASLTEMLSRSFDPSQIPLFPTDA